ncbi:MAG: G5 domain-containing protein [Clostridia bacterium]|nr:G5 domain-containing protein [Clostridia bacterium]
MLQKLLNAIRSKSAYVKLYCVVLVVLLCAALVLGFAANTVPARESIQIIKGETSVTVNGRFETVGEALALAGITLSEGDYLNCSVYDKADDVPLVVISSRPAAGFAEGNMIDTATSFDIWERPLPAEEDPALEPGDDNQNDDGDSDAEDTAEVDYYYGPQPDTTKLPEDFEPIVTPVATAVPTAPPTTVPTATPEATATPVPTPTPTPTPVPTPTPEPTPVITVDWKDVPEEIGFDTVYVDDDTMAKGSTRVVSEGQKGIITKVWEITFTDGVETSRKLVATKNTKDPVNRVVARGTIDTFTDSRGEKVMFKRRIDGDATAYSNSGWGTAIAYGAQLGGLTVRWGVIAVDPNVIPLGTKVYVKGINGINDYGYAIAADTGGGIVNNRIDVYMDDLKLIDIWGVRDVVIYILEDQSVDVFALRGSAKWTPPAKYNYYPE